MRSLLITLGTAFVILVSAAILTSRGLLRYDRENQSGEKASASPVLSQSSPGSTSMAPRPSPELYEDAMLGFELTIPADWRRYQVSEAANAVVFSVPGSGATSKLIPVLFIYFLPDTQWVPQPNGLSSPLKTYLGKNQRYAFGYEQTQDPGGIPPQVLNEIPQVIQSFATLP